MLIILGNQWKPLGNDWDWGQMVGAEIPLIWSLCERDSKKQMIGPHLDFCWQLVIWLRTIPTGGQRRTTISTRTTNYFLQFEYSLYAGSLGSNGM